MDLIAKAMQKNLHMCENEDITGQTWELFQKQAVGKKLFLFGTGSGAEYFFRNCCDHIEIEGVIDNDPKKQNRELGLYSAEAFQTEYENILIQSPEVLDHYSKQDIAVLITSINYYELMNEQLKRMGIENRFVMLIMEAKKRKYFLEKKTESFEETRNKYRDWCCQQKVEKKIVMRIGEYGGHARCITGNLLKYGSDLDIVWLVHEPVGNIPDGVRIVLEKNWKRYLYEMETSKIWLFDINVPEFVSKRKEQIYIQVKHWSSITLKKFYLDDKSSCVSDETAERIRQDGARMDYLFSGSEMDEKSCRSGLAFRGQAVRLGSARSDTLFDRTIREKVLQQFHLSNDIHILLYAPTYRQKGFAENRSMSVTLKTEALLETLKSKWGKNWILFIRLHPWIDFKKSGLTESETIVNAGNYPEVEELVAASDVMVTDYSSVMFEGAFIGKPVFLYAPDRKEYIDGERGLLIDYDTLPFPIAETNGELKQHILDFDRNSYEKRVSDFLEQYGVREDGHAGERAAEFIMELLERPLI